MASEMQADVTAARRALQAVIEAAGEAVVFMNEVDKSLNLRIGTLPAQTPTEDQIVAALKADPAMAGRVIGRLVRTLDDYGRRQLSREAGCLVAGNGLDDSYNIALQSLAVALAAASYRG